MSFQQLVCDKPLRGIALRIDKRHMMVDVADTLQLIGMSMMMWTSVDANQEDGDVRPREAQEIELELVHVGSFTIEKEQ